MRFRVQVMREDVYVLFRKAEFPKDSRRRKENLSWTETKHNLLRVLTPLLDSEVEATREER